MNVFQAKSICYKYEKEDTQKVIFPNALCKDT